MNASSKSKERSKRRMLEYLKATIEVDTSIAFYDQSTFGLRVAQGITQFELEPLPPIESETK